MKLFLFFCLSFSLSVVYAGPFEEGNNALAQKDYSKAIDAYNLLLKDNIFSPELYNNLGLAYSGIDSIGQARLYFEKALKLSPSKATYHNVDVLKTKMRDSFIEVEPIFMIRWINGLARILSSNTWFVLAFFLALGSFVYFIYWRTKKTLYKNFRWMLLVFFIVASLFFLLSGRAHHLQANLDDAVIVLPEISVKKGADINAAELMVIHAGTKVRVLDNINKWLKIRLPNGESGWVADTDIVRF